MERLKNADPSKIQKNKKKSIFDKQLTPVYDQTLSEDLYFKIYQETNGNLYFLHPLAYKYLKIDHPDQLPLQL